MKPVTLHKRIQLLMLLPTALLSVVMIGFFTYFGMQTLEQELRDRGASSVRFLAPVAEFNLITGQTEQLQTLVQTAVREHKLKAALVLSNKGRPLAVAGQVSISAEFFRGMQTGTQGVLEEGDHWLAFGAPILRIMPPLDPLFDDEPPRTIQDETVGYVISELDKQPMISGQRALMLQGLLLLLVALLAIGIIARQLAKRFGAPLQRLHEGLTALGTGKLDIRLEGADEPELRELESAFNTSAEYLASACDQADEEQQRLQSQLLFQSRHDLLTGALNRQTFLLSLSDSLTRTPGSTPVLLIVLYIHGLHRINQSLGPLAGDELLRQFTTQQLMPLSHEGLLGRLQGSTFAISLHGLDLQASQTLIQHFVREVEHFRFLWEGKVTSIRISIGWHCSPSNSVPADLRLSFAEDACREARLVSSGGIVQSSDSSPPIPAVLDQARPSLFAFPLRALRAHSDYPVTLVRASPSESSPQDVAVQQRLLQGLFRMLSEAHYDGHAFLCIAMLDSDWMLSPQLFDWLCTLASMHPSGAIRIGLAFPEAPLCSSDIDLIDQRCKRLRSYGLKLGLSDPAGSAVTLDLCKSLHLGWLILDEQWRGSDPLRHLIDTRSIKTIRLYPDSTTLPDDSVDYLGGDTAGPVEPLDSWIEGVALRRY